ncbi:MAG: DUF45 domain-containing protein [Saprospiraceae bacterium]|nr:DUF45 domain-containing protein [Saprospiraceae bacterium]
MPKVKDLYIEASGIQVPAKIYKESRSDVRASIGKKSVILRLPSWIDKEEQKIHYDWFVDWVGKQFEEQPELIRRFYTKSYQDGEELEVCGKTYKLHLRPSKRSDHYARLYGSNILLNVNFHDEPANLHKSVRHLISRVVARDLKPMVEERVRELNQLHFQQEIRSINLKYNLTNWGSCSSEGNVNLSTRLLLVPEDVRDYVIIHELAHLIELNHSKRFWNLVRRAMPDYKRHERWLTSQGEKIDF